ncbi:unnamed protein product [Malus baccata var. baccata]
MIQVKVSFDRLNIFLLDDDLKDNELGNLPSLRGEKKARGIFSWTICENILFGKATDKNKYEKTIKACALDKDINSFEDGDLTEIGQRGVNMRGGQKHWIHLARAVYTDADMYFLDDPFSTVDAHTATTLFHVRKTKSRVL